jgi:hypothetical protein
LGDFFSYSIARYDDVSWGTKAVAVSGAAPSSASAEARAAARRAVRGGGEGGDAGDAPSPRAAKAAAQRRAKETRERSEAALGLTNTASAAQFAAAVVVAVANFALSRFFPSYLLYLGVATSSIGFGIMFCSLVFFVGHGVCGGGGGGGARGDGCLARARALACAVGWTACAGAVVLVALAPGSASGNYAALAFGGVFAALIVGVAVPTALWG